MGRDFAPEIMDRIGEPYVTGRRNLRHSVDVEAGGLGLACSSPRPCWNARARSWFRQPGGAGARRSVRVRWARADFEQNPSRRCEAASGIAGIRAAAGTSGFASLDCQDL